MVEPDQGTAVPGQLREVAELGLEPAHRLVGQAALEQRPDALHRAEHRGVAAATQLGEPGDLCGAGGHRVEVPGGVSLHAAPEDDVPGVEGLAQRRDQPLEVGDVEPGGVQVAALEACDHAEPQAEELQPHVRHGLCEHHDLGALLLA